ncbi:hypothetical protein QMK19_00120 [Streptomyces sp. H10-C2]|nr:MULTISPECIES: hypothetical protein [unclassified Streptomyces]MDJ0340423.1 hypothetical protein [Streptomyces sp. PH10-H1]MDJ0368129.1 hypothetical protein [Streptomyces sp. H10-C2]
MVILVWGASQGGIKFSGEMGNSHVKPLPSAPVVPREGGMR